MSDNSEMDVSDWIIFVAVILLAAFGFISLLQDMFEEEIDYSDLGEVSYLNVAHNGSCELATSGMKYNHYFGDCTGVRQGDLYDPKTQTVVKILK